MIDPEQPNLPAAQKTDSLPVSQDLWKRLAEPGCKLNAQEKAELIRHQRRCLAIAASMLDPTGSNLETIENLISPLLALPARTQSGLAGEAALEGYRIGLEDLPKAVLRRAVTAALKDPERRWRPTPNELLAYAEPEMAERRNRMANLKWLYESPAALPKPEPRPSMTGEEREAMRLRMEQLAADIGSRLSADEARRKAEREPSILAPKEPEVPRAETLMNVLGLSREQADARVAEILSKRGAV